jgi:peptide methionine sulfoxide reductase msrA/msrB
MDQKKTDPPTKAQQGQAVENTMPPLTAAEAHIIRDKGTEAPFTGKYWDYFGQGAYLCRQCGTWLYTSKSKFRSECGWPSFDEEIPGAVIRQGDADGRRTEIICAHCGAHLGHVFTGEHYTEKNTRHCVNSASIVFRTAEEMRQAADKAAAAQAAAAQAAAPVAPTAPAVPAAPTAPAAPAAPAAEPATEVAIFAGGCFWGVEHFLEKAPGVISATSGYTGGATKNPTYEQVCTDITGHAEAVKVVYDPARTSYEALARLFFETHDPTAVNSQGPDAGTQYRSAIFYMNDQQKTIADKLIKQLCDKGYKVATEVEPASTFYPAEEYHQDYLDKHPDRPDCHIFTPRFEIPLEP